MTLTRMIFLALAVLLPTTWTVAKAEDEKPAGEAGGKKKGKKGKKDEKTEKSEIK